MYLVERRLPRPALPSWQRLQLHIIPLPEVIPYNFQVSGTVRRIEGRQDLHDSGTAFPQKQEFAISWAPLRRVVLVTVPVLKNKNSSCSKSAARSTSNFLLQTKLIFRTWYASTMHRPQTRTYMETLIGVHQQSISQQRKGREPEPMKSLATTKKRT